MIVKGRMWSTSGKKEACSQEEKSRREGPSQKNLDHVIKRIHLRCSLIRPNIFNIQVRIWSLIRDGSCESARSIELEAACELQGINECGSVDNESLGPARFDTVLYRPFFVTRRSLL